jgi:hypothetical protein
LEKERKKAEKSGKLEAFRAKISGNVRNVVEKKGAV